MKEEHKREIIAKDKEIETLKARVNDLEAEVCRLRLEAQSMKA